MFSYVFFDLGDTLIHRDQSLLDADAILVERVTNISSQTIKQEILNLVFQYPALYSFQQKSFDTIVDEDNYSAEFCYQLGQKLNIPTSQITKIIQQRVVDSRYRLFSGTIELLQELSKMNFILGVISNGRPSRRRIMEQLNIVNYFKPDLVFISDEIHLVKPSPELFDYISFNCKSSKIYLCDDEQNNLYAAQVSGWCPLPVNHHTYGYEKVRETLFAPSC